MSSSRPVVLITGANTGLGLEAIKALIADSEYEILLGCRSLKKGEDAIATLKNELSSSKSVIAPIQFDVSSDESITKAFETVSSQYGRLDVLVNNAGVNLETEVQAGKMTMREGWNKIWDTNVVGAHITSLTFMPLLVTAPEPRLVFITSGTSSLVETQIHDEGSPLSRINQSPPAGWPKAKELNPVVGYRSSKTGMNMLVTQWDRILKKDGVKVFAVSPGFLATGLNGLGVEQLRKMGAIEPHIGGEFLRDVIVGRRDEQAGKLIRKDAEQPW